VSVTAAARRERASLAFDEAAPLLSVDGLRVELPARRAVTVAVDEVSYDIGAGETLAVVGESGSGKSMTARAVMGILPPRARVTAGGVRFRGVDLLTLPERERREIRGARIAMVFQNALSALNPVLTIGRQLAELFEAHTGVSRGAAKKRSVELLELVRIPAARTRVNDYPHQFSGGMRQRVVIAMALALDPDVVIADEPTTALDVTVQAQIMRLFAEVKRERKMGLLLITHDMGVVADIADRVAVMYAGKIVEEGSAIEIYTRPAHPYTKALLRSIPQAAAKGRRLAAIPGAPPDLARVPSGCPFHPRCDYLAPRCHTDVPPAYLVSEGHSSRCHFWQQVVAD
jgi:oligopeptide transport system ATP-binding protein